MTIKMMNWFVLLTTVVVTLNNVVIPVESCHSSQTSAAEDTQTDVLSKTDLEHYRSIKRFQKQQQRAKRSVHQYYLELLIVVDQSMVDYHGEDLVPFLTATMAAVQHRFKHALVDDSIQIQVTDIFQLHNSSEHIDYTNGSTILESFCTWKQKAVTQHDAALFMTRAKFYILGRANIGSVCLNNSCLMVRDTGMASANLIAHELGHLLGSDHDESAFCAYFGNSTTKHPMSDIIGPKIEWWKWSECSSWTMTHGLRKLENQCLTNSSFKGDYLQLNEDHRFLGQHYSLDKQCELRNRFRPRACSYTPCERLRCKKLDDPERFCYRTDDFLWADGTECGAGKWCENGQCVQADQELIQRLKYAKWTYSDAEDHKTESKINTVNTTIIIICSTCLLAAVAIGIFVVFRLMKR